MIRLEVPGALGADCLPGVPGEMGPYVVTTWTEVRTESGPLPWPGEALLYPRLGAPGLVAGQGQSSGIAWLHQGGWVTAGATFGINPVIFDAGGNLALATVAQGSQGYRYVADDGRLVTGDDTVNSQTVLAQSYGLTGFWEWSRLGDLTMGQGQAYALTEGPHGRRVLEPGGCYDIRFTRRGASCAVALIKRPDAVAVCLWFQADELAGLPLEPTQPPIDPPVDPPVDPPEPPVTFPETAWSVVERMHATFAKAISDTHPDREAAARAWTQMTIEQLVFTFPTGGWLWKSGDPNRPPSKDVVARQRAGTFEGWDVLQAASINGPLVLAQYPPGYHDLTGQHPIPVMGQNHLGATPPDPPDPPTDDLAQRVTALEAGHEAHEREVGALSQRIGDNTAAIVRLLDRVRALEEAPPSGLTPEDRGHLARLDSLLAVLRSGLDTSSRFSHSHKVKWPPS